MLNTYNGAHYNNKGGVNLEWDFEKATEYDGQVTTFGSVVLQMIGVSEVEITFKPNKMEIGETNKTWLRFHTMQRTSELLAPS